VVIRIVFIILILIHAALAQPQYTVDALGIPGPLASLSPAYAINERGQIVGSYIASVLSWKSVA